MPELSNNTEEPKDKNLEGNAGQSDTDNADDNQKDGGEEMVTKAEAQRMADAMVAKKLKGMPSKDELAKYKEWKEAQKTDAEKQAEAQKRYQEMEAENTALKREKQVIAKGVKPSDADYVLFKVDKMEGEDFDANLEAFLSENPNFVTQDNEKKESKTDGAGVKRATQTPSNSIKDRLKARHPNIELED